MSNKERYERMKAQGKCVQCGKKPAEEGKVLCNACLKRAREYGREHYQKPEYQEYMREYNRARNNTVEYKFSMDSNSAKRRGYSWVLSIDQAGFCYTQPCHYCGEEPNGKLNGIDRQDSSAGYDTENCVPCCSTCNYAKWQMSPEEFIWHCEKVVRFNKK